MPDLLAEPDPAPVRTLLEGADGAGFRLAWLGQAGFLLRAGGLRLAIDPYLSDSLAKKYAGRAFPHVRMMAAPIAPERMAPLDIVLVSHGHTDHMDPDTLAPLARANPACRFVVPVSETAKAIERGVPPPRLIAIDAGETLALAPSLAVAALPSAHEDLRTDAAGRHLFLGYVLSLAGGPSLYHSGDCIPYPGLEARLRALRPDLALLPVNGRDADRLAQGVPGNFTAAEAAALCVAAGVPRLIAHHFGMFAENTVEHGVVEAALAARADALQAWAASPTTLYRLS